MPRHQPPPDLSPAIHPLALPAFNTFAALGGECWPIGAVRAVKVDSRPLVFAGFGWLAGDPSRMPLRIEADPGDDAILEAAWGEVAAVVAILSRTPSRRQRFALALARTVPEAELHRFGLPRTREPRLLLRRSGVPPRARQAAPQPTIFQVARDQFLDEWPQE